MTSTADRQDNHLLRNDIDDTFFFSTDHSATILTITITITMSSPNVKAAVDEALARYESNNPKSRALYQDAVKHLPGGNTRSLLHTNPFPIMVKSGQGHMLIDEDGHKYQPPRHTTRMGAGLTQSQISRLHRRACSGSLWTQQPSPHQGPNRRSHHRRPLPGSNPCPRGQIRATPV